MSKTRLYLYMMLGAGAIAIAQFSLAAGQTAGPQTPNGALPGNDIGTGSSLPRSPYASNIISRDTRSPIAPTPPAPNLPPGAPTRQ
jgi:hypothetical protein